MNDAAQRANRVLGLFNQYQRRVYSFACRSLPSTQAEDVVQEVYLRLLEHPRLEELEISPAFLIKIADNLIKRNYLRNRKFHEVQDRIAQNMRSSPRYNGMYTSDGLGASSGTASSLNSRPGAHTAAANTGDTRHEAVGYAYERLNDREKAALRFIVVEDLTYQDAATAMGVPVTTVNNWKHRAVTKARSFATEFVETHCEPRSGAPAQASE
ncbi:MAG: RNA polymerase sigma factor, partial [Planctomycetota bacterium]